MTSTIERPRPKRGLTGVTVALFERWMPDPFVIAIAPPVKRGIQGLVGFAKTPNRAVVLTLLNAMTELVVL